MKTNFLEIILYPLFLILVLSANLYAQTKPEQKKLNVAILVYDGIYLLDFTGPLEVFFDTFSTDGQQLFNVYTVSPTKQFKAHSGLNITSDYEVKNCPKPDILVVPGGNLQLLKNNDSLKNWIINTAEKSAFYLYIFLESLLNIYVGNLPYATTGQELNEIFSDYGEVASAKIIMDRDTGRSKGFGFVEMGDTEANKAIEELNGAEYYGKQLLVNEKE